MANNDAAGGREPDGNATGRSPASQVALEAPATLRLSPSIPSQPRQLLRLEQRAAPPRAASENHSVGPCSNQNPLTIG